MKINFTKKQYRRLIDSVFLGDMVINGIRIQEEQIKEYEELRKYIYSFSKEMGCEDIIQFDKNDKEYYETRNNEDGGILDFLSDYDYEIFWDNIVRRLAKRDVARKQRLMAEELTSDEWMRLVSEREEDYEQEFEANGLENLIVEFQKKLE